MDLTTNGVTDEGVPFLLGLKKLTHLYLMSNRVTEKTIPDLFGELKNLEVLDVRFNINDAGVKEMLKGKKP